MQTAPQLKQFQIEGAVFLSQRTRAMLADEPGVGKTPQLCTAAHLVGAKTGLVVCPSIAVEHWLRELQKWNVRPRFDFRVISWDEAHKLRDRLPGPDKAPMQWDVLIPDEGHYGKNPSARRAQAVLAKGGLAWYARRIWAASGTFAPNNATELWTWLRAFGAVGMDYEQFKRYFCVVDDQGKVRGNRQDHIDELRVILKTYSLRRLKKDVLPELGAIDIQEWYVKPDARWAGPGPGYSADSEALRKRLTAMPPEDLLTFLAGDEEFATLRRYNALLKAPAVFDAVKFELSAGLLDKVVIFGYHKESLAALHGAFSREGIPATLIFGDTPKGLRDGMIEGWKRSGRVLIASSIIAETALDFTAAHQGIMLEMDSVPGRNWQAMQRMHRFGQTNPVTVRVAMGTPIDEWINGIIVRKVRDLKEVWQDA